MEVVCLEKKRWKQRIGRTLICLVISTGKQIEFLWLQTSYLFNQYQQSFILLNWTSQYKELKDVCNRVSDHTFWTQSILCKERRLLLGKNQYRAAEDLSPKCKSTSRLSNLWQLTRYTLVAKELKRRIWWYGTQHILLRW